jgi:hypothetical protein
MGLKARNDTEARYLIASVDRRQVGGRAPSSVDGPEVGWPREVHFDEIHLAAAAGGSPTRTIDGPRPYQRQLVELSLKV